MGGKLSNHLQLSETDLEFLSKTKVTIICAEWHHEITRSLQEAALAIFIKHKVQTKSIQVPGAFELPFAASLSLRYDKPDAVICLGCVIKGDTDHNLYINHAVSTAIMKLNLQYQLPVIFGLLTVDTVEQAKERSGGKLGNKGEEAAITALKMMLLQKSSSIKNG